MVIGDGKVAEPLGGLDDGGRETHLDVPLNVAVEEVDAGVLGLEAQNGVGVAHDGDGVAARGLLVEAGAGDAGPDACAGSGASDDLEVVAVEVEGVVGFVVVVDDDVDDVTVVHDEGVDGAVDEGVGVVLAGGGGRVEGGHLLVDIGGAVYASAGDAILVKAKCPVVLEDLGGGREDGNVSVGLEDGIVRRAPFLDNVSTEGSVREHDQLSGVVEGPALGKVLVAVVAVDIGGDEETIVAVIAVNTLDENIITLSGSNAQHV